jgi:hypothetical protein
MFFVTCCMCATVLWMWLHSGVRKFLYYPISAIFVLISFLTSCSWPKFHNCNWLFNYVANHKWKWHKTMDISLQVCQAVNKSFPKRELCQKKKLQYGGYIVVISTTPTLDSPALDCYVWNSTLSTENKEYSGRPTQLTISKKPRCHSFHNPGWLKNIC